MLDILLRQGFTVEEETEFKEKLVARGLKRQIDMERQEAEAHFLQDWKRRIDDGSYEAEVGDEFESAEDYESAYRQQEDYVECEKRSSRKGRRE